jgi:hypothetical protein
MCFEFPGPAISFGAMQNNREQLITFIKSFDKFFTKVDFTLYSNAELQDLQDRLLARIRQESNSAGTQKPTQPEQ